MVCESNKRGRLFEPKSMMQEEKVIANFVSASVLRYWLGIKYDTTSNTWKYSSGKYLKYLISLVHTLSHLSKLYSIKNFSNCPLQEFYKSADP